MKLWLSLLFLLQLGAAASKDGRPARTTTTTTTTTSAPSYWGCQDSLSKSLPYCDAGLSITDRLNDLRNRLTLSEKIAAIAPLENMNTCTCHTSNISRIGLPWYMWLVETNTMVNSKCMDDEDEDGEDPKRGCATQFPGPLSMAASFNRTSWRLKGSVMGSEQRALMNLHQRRRTGPQDFIGFTAYGPNMNQQRDPRFGRSSELPGEDPLLTGQYAAHMVQGLQEKDSGGRPKVLAYLKHFTAYSKETDRGHDTYNISMFDLFDTYLPQFEMAFAEGNATGVMCSYNGINGVPSCANSFLLQDVMRRRWNQPLAHVTTDCGAVNNLKQTPALAPDDAHAAAWALMNGTDIEMGSNVWSHHLEHAVQLGLATEEAVDQAFTRSYYHHFVVGRFDDPSHSEWSKLGQQDIYSTFHQQVQLEAALQGIVLLKHDYHSPILPLSPGRTMVAVLGPLSQERAGLMSDYWGDEICVGGGFDCVPTLAESIAVVHGQDYTTTAKGVDVDSNATDGIPLALELARHAEVVILCLGITKQQEHEGIDRTDTALPGQQINFALQVYQVGTPIILVLVNGGQVALDGLVDTPAAIIEAFNPNVIGGTALAKLLFGQENRWGKLPYTIYPYATMQAFDMANYDMSAPPGRTYRYYTGTPIFPFGYGLSLTQFQIDCQVPEKSTWASNLRSQPIPIQTDSVIRLECTVHNVGKRAGDEVVQIYRSSGDHVRARADHPVPIRQLVDFARVTVNPGQSQNITFELSVAKTFALVNSNGDKVLYGGVHRLLVTNNGVQEESFVLEFAIPNNDEKTVSL